MRAQLRPHQAAAIAGLRASLVSGKHRVMLQLPTGAGKTVVAAAIAEMAVAKGNTVSFVVPALSLVDQTVDRFLAEGLPEVGVVQGRHAQRA